MGEDSFLKNNVNLLVNCNIFKYIHGPMISMMWKMQAKSQNPLIKIIYCIMWNVTDQCHSEHYVRTLSIWMGKQFSTVKSSRNMD